MRASDADRQLVVHNLQRAHDDGRLTLAEFDERTRQAYSARTYADLAVLTVDLPDAVVAPYRPPAVGPAAAVPEPAEDAKDVVKPRASPAWRVVGSTWFAVSMINFLIWGVISLAVGDALYPWWIWVAGPWGAVLLVGWLSGLGQRRGADD